MKGLTLVKLGGSVITRKTDDRMEVRARVLNRLASEVSSALRVRPRMKLLMVHGAGPFGHVLADDYELQKGHRGPLQVEGVAVTHQSMESLNSTVVNALLTAGVNAMAYQPSAAGVLEDGRLASFPLEPVERLLGLGIVPVSYGDVLADLKRGLGILSGDHLIPYLAEKLAAERVVIVTSYNGVFDRDPRVKGAVKYDVVDEKMLLKLRGRSTEGRDVTGGIARKVGELVSLARRGVKSEIISGVELGYLERALKGEKGIGTRIE